MAEISKANWLGIVGLIGSILMIVGVFVSWVDIDLNVLITTLSESYTGIDIFTDESIEDVEYGYAGIVTLVAGIIALITTILPIVMKNPKVNRALGAVSLVLAIVAVILMVLFNGQMESFEIIGYTVASASSGIGLWISLAGAVILALGGIIDIAMKYAVKSE